MTEAPDPHARPSGGRRLRWRETAGFVFSEATYPARARAPRHVHELAGLAVVLEGGYQKRMQGSDHTCRPGSLTLEPPGVSHAESYGDRDVRVLLIEISPERLATITDRMPSFSLLVCTSHPSARYLGERAAVELVAPDGASSLALEGLALELIAAAARPARPDGHESSSAPAWLRLITARLRDEFRSDHTLGALAGDAGVHPTHLARVFRAREGCSVGEFVRRRRIEWAAAQLATTTVPLSSLAQSAGFYDQSHFTRIFTKRMGVSPARYRALTRSPR
jgi:AraC family transcriptional regulator